MSDYDFHGDDLYDGGNLEEDAASDDVRDDADYVDRLLQAMATADPREQDDAEVMQDVGVLAALVMELAAQAYATEQRMRLTLSVATAEAAEQLAVRAGVLERRLREHARSQRGRRLRKDAAEAQTALAVARATSARTLAWLEYEVRTARVHPERALAMYGSTALLGPEDAEDNSFATRESAEPQGAPRDSDRPSPMTISRDQGGDSAQFAASVAERPGSTPRNAQAIPRPTVSYLNRVGAKAGVVQEEVVTTRGAAKSKTRRGKKKPKATCGTLSESDSDAPPDNQ